MRSGERTSPRYSEDTEAICCAARFQDLYAFFSAQFAVDNCTFGADNLQPDTARSRAPVCPQLGYATVLIVSSPDTNFFARALRPFFFFFRQGRRARAKNLVSGDETTVLTAQEVRRSENELIK